MNQTKYNLLKRVRDDIVNCHACELYKSRKLPVIGNGSHDAEIMFIGEAPGEEEDRTGSPFVGIAGQVFNKLLTEIGIRRSDVYVCNIIKCHPPKNRDPKTEEKSACLSFLTRQIEAISPKLIVCLGRHAAAVVLPLFGLEKKVASMSIMHGKVFEPDGLFKSMAIRTGALSMSDIKFIVMYHPASVLYNQAVSKQLKNDFQVLKSIILKRTSLLSIPTKVYRS